jgi:hypothetical protein
MVCPMPGPWSTVSHAVFRPWGEVGGYISATLPHLLKATADSEVLLAESSGQDLVFLIQNICLGRHSWEGMKDFSGSLASSLSKGQEAFSEVAGRL